MAKGRRAIACVPIARPIFLVREREAEVHEAVQWATGDHRPKPGQGLMDHDRLWSFLGGRKVEAPERSTDRRQDEAELMSTGDWVAILRDASDTGLRCGLA
jgi:hypothetical protein